MSRLTLSRTHQDKPSYRSSPGVGSFKSTPLWSVTLLLLTIVTSENIRLGLLVDEPSVNVIVALNATLTFLHKDGVNVTLVQREARKENFSDYLFQVCDILKEDVSGIVSYTSCQSLKLLLSQHEVFQIPHIAVYNDFCKSARYFQNSFSLSMREDAMVIVDLVDTIIRDMKWDHVGLLYDDTYTAFQIQSLLFAFSSHYLQTYLMKLTHSEVDKQLKSITQRHQHVTNFLLLVNQSNFMEIAISADKVGLVSNTSNYWVVISDEIVPLSMLSSFSYKQNILLVTKSQGKDCPTPLATFMSETIPDIKLTEAYFVDALVSMAEVINFQREKNKCQIKATNSTITNCDASPYQPWPDGPQLLQHLNKIDRVGLTGPLKFKDGYNDNSERNILSLRHYDDTPYYHPVGKWSRDDGLKLTGSYFRPPPIGYDNKTFIVGTKEAIPFVRRTQTDNFTHYDGFCIDILNELATIMNFRYELVEPPDDLWGAQEKDGSFSGIVGMVGEQKLDFGIGPITINAERERGIDFTTPFMEDGIGIVMKRPADETNNLFRMFRPFHGFVWLAMGSSVIFIGISLYLFNHINHSGLTRNHSSDGKIRHGLRESVWLIFSSLMEQGAETHPVSVPGRVIVGTWWVVTILLVSSYTANLAAFLTVTIVDKPIETLEDLANDPEILPLVKTGTSVYSSFRASRSNVYQKIWSKLETGPQLTENNEAYEYVRTGKYAFMVDKTQIEYLVNTDCETFMLADESFDNAGLGFVFPENSPMLNDVSYNIIRMQEAGLIERWRQKWWASSETCSVTGPASHAKRLGLDSTGGPFIIYGIAVGAAFLCLLFEKAVSHLCYRKNTTVYDVT